MSPEAQRREISIAVGEIFLHEFDGILRPARRSGDVVWPFHDDQTAQLTEWLGDLNAMHKAEGVLVLHQAQRFYEELHRLVAGHRVFSDGLSARFSVVHATAAQRAEAFLRTLNLWDDSK